MNDIKNRKLLEKFNITKNWFFERLKKYVGLQKKK